MAKAWIRRLSVLLTSEQSSSGKHRQLRFGSIDDVSTDNELSIKVICNKYMSSLKDEAIVEISNLNYEQMVRIVHGKFYNVEIQAGYRGSNVQTVFKGAVAYISNQLTDTKTNTVIIICTSYMVARYGQKKLNLALNQGIDMFTKIKHVLAMGGIRDASLSGQLKKQLSNNVETVDTSATSWLEALVSENESFIVNVDAAVSGRTLSIFDAARSNSRTIKLTSDIIDLSGGYPRLTNEGLNISVMPTFAFMCGDVVNVDSSLIDISVSNRDEISKNYGYFIDKEGNYMIMSMKYVLENRGPQFGLNLQCKTRSLISNYIGVT